MRGDNVISIDKGAGGARRGVDTTRAHSLIAACRQSCGDTLPRLLQELFDHLDDELYQLADKSTSDVLQTRYFDAMREIRKLRGGIEQAFLRDELARFDRFWRNPAGVIAEQAPAVDDTDELSLVAEDELEENLAVTGMAAKAENRYSRELFALNLRFAQLAGVNELPSRCNPIGPLGLADGFRAALRPWDGDLDVRLVVFKLFDRYVMGYVGGLYDEINDRLAEAGVLPKIVQRVRRNPVAPSVQRERDQAQAPGVATPGEDALAGDHLTDEISQEQVLGMLGQVLSLQRQLRGASLYSGHLPGADTRYRHLPAVGSHELLQALHQLQHDIAVETPVNRAEIQTLQGETLVSLGRQLRMGTSDAPAKRLNQVDQDVIDIIGMLFDFILDDQNVPDAMKALIGRLQIPMLKVAVLDRSFFGNKHHPARRLLNVLARAAVGWVDDGDRSARSLYGRIEAAVTRVLDEFSEDLGLFDAVYDDFANFVEREARGAEVAEERINQVTRGQEQLLIARRHVAQVLNEFRVAHPDLPIAVVNILREAWHDVMLLAYLREGEESAAWRHAHDVVRQLIWSIEPKVETDDRQVLLKKIPELLKHLRDGLNNISFDQHRAAELFKDLQTCHIAALRGQHETIETKSSDAVLPDDLPLASHDTPDFVDDEAHATADGLAVGQWLEWLPDGRSPGAGWLRGKLSWRSQVSSACIFVNRKGMKVAEMTVYELATLFRDDRARLLEDIDKPLIDRALTAMVSQVPDPAPPPSRD